MWQLAGQHNLWGPATIACTVEEGNWYASDGHFVATCTAASRTVCLLQISAVEKKAECDQHHSQDVDVGSRQETATQYTVDEVVN